MTGINSYEQQKNLHHFEPLSTTIRVNTKNSKIDYFCCWEEAGDNMPGDSRSTLQNDKYDIIFLILSGLADIQISCKAHVQHAH